MNCYILTHFNISFWVVLQKRLLPTASKVGISKDHVVYASFDNILIWHHQLIIHKTMNINSHESSKTVYTNPIQFSQCFS